MTGCGSGWKRKNKPYMSKLNMLDTESPKEKALLVGVNLRRSEDLLSLEDSLQELELLADTAGVEVVGVETQNLDTPNSKTFIGKGKVEEVKILAGELDADMVIFDNELSPVTSVNWRTLLESRYG